MTIRASRTFIVSPVIAALGGLLAAVVLSAIQVGIGKCDPKLGCSGGIWIAGAMAALMGLLVSVLVAFFGHALSEIAPGKLREHHICWASLLASLAIAIWLTSDGWAY